jgi:hypothetical protein
MQNLLADMGVPMIAAYWPPAWLALAPIIVVEAWFARRAPGIGWKSALWSVAIANAVSTFLGIPCAWLIWTIIELRYFGGGRELSNPLNAIYAVTVQAPWLLPYDSDMWWMVPASLLILTGVFYLMSVGIEGLVMRLIFRGAEASFLRGWAWKANAVSYAGLYLFVVICGYLPIAGLVERIAGPAVSYMMNLAWRLSSSRS